MASMMSDLTRRIAENLAEVRRRIADTAARSGRTGDDVTLVAITKYVGEREIRGLVAAGCDLLGENRPQGLWRKAEACRDVPIRWHLVGHLQRNKVRRTLPLVEMIQSVDGPRLISAIDRIAGELAREPQSVSFQPSAFSPQSPGPSAQAPAFSSRRMPLLMEVNVSGEAAKHGFEPDAVEPFLEELAGYQHVEVRGLMCMASFTGGLDAARRDFAALRNLRDRLQGKCPEGVTLDELSMGMSGDYELAIEEGATIVRIGSALYKGLL
jgi:uncharacterized pyridoxal phosphate-containing UPF0001 family protein